MGQSSSRYLNVYIVYTLCTPSGHPTRSALFVSEEGSSTGDHYYLADDAVWGYCYNRERVTYSTQHPKFKGTELVFTGTTRLRRYPKSWDSLLCNLPAERLSGKQMVAMSREKAEDLLCHEALTLLRINIS
ncbi:hypothetical protein DTO013E5_3799 [Penicillium roqueforti]|uniref:Genomic scaffold, ProqFM164S01 n=1 Tax=Penicillium roqueforti (strain FM164) TaxID=1365484 RepID=W6PVQ9_PENRF|nr:uncharacterized protein LCP9604111_1769 [Penicillium roqueforti]CDM28303.1 unnamed protein product [Penicillium roqueforti FM164]KAF9251773.1 hypothetical protein LCP9604111_1769 [Penicillium roqueforti]KAI1836412.1 hypothetical protein CBS147337_2639 [Penicillium roqueforti]KAI2685449.1 hypothetical protein LCP963914a_4776 [Penicillium roqueforti]KAI2690183.1 hypothetical protein CBS147355_634 [Penicillium roqueforti]